MELTLEQIVAYWEHRHPGQLVGNRCKAAVKCVFHSDSNPSCTLFLDGNGGFNCMGCGAKGNLFQFEMRFSACDARQAEINVAAITGAKTNSRGEGKEDLGPPTDFYDYRDENGSVLFQKRRYEPETGGKTFRSFHKTGYGWRLGIDPKEGARTRRVLFNLPDLVIANTVIVVEGEKCVRAVTNANLFAGSGCAIAVTTSYDGAWKPGQKPKWLDSYNPYFTGKHVFILADNDLPGRAYADHIAASIARLAYEVRVVNLPGLEEQEDVADFLQTHSAMELQQAMVKTEAWSSEQSADPLRITAEEAEGSTAELLEALTNWVTTYVLVTPEQAVVLAVWVLHTYVMEATEYTPYLSIQGPEKGCGKTLLMEVLSAVCSNSLSVSGCTPPSLLRAVDKFKPTLFLDEMDAAKNGNKELAEAQRGILNAGFKRGGIFLKCQGVDNDIREFNAFGAKCFAGIGELQDTVASRSIPIEMRRKMKSEEVKKFRGKHALREAGPIKIAAGNWAAKVVAVLKESEPEPLDSLQARQNDVTEILLAIAALAGEQWKRKISEALLCIFGSAAAEDASVGVTLLADIRVIFSQCRTGALRNTQQISSRELAEQLCEIEGRRWAEIRNGKPLDANKLAQLLKPYGIHPTTIRMEDKTPKGYRHYDFEDAWERYCPVPPNNAATPPQPSLRLAESEIRACNTNGDVAVTSSQENPDEHSTVAAVAPVEELLTQPSDFPTPLLDPASEVDDGVRYVWI